MTSPLYEAHEARVNYTQATDDAQNTRSWKIFADAINHAWRKSAGDFIECGRLLAEANAELDRDAFNAMVKSKLDFVPSVARKLIRIAANRTLCSPGNKLPPAWTILYQLSQLPEAALKAALADGTIHPGMSRAAASALKPSKKPAAAKAETPTSAPAELGRAWKTASADQRQHFLDRVGCADLIAAMSSALQAEFRGRVADPTVVGASETTPFARYATDKFHSALAVAEQAKTNDASAQHMTAVLVCIAKRAAADGIARSNVVIAESKRKGRR